MDCLRDGDNGLLVEAGDIAGQSQALGRLIEDRALRVRLADAALEGCRRVYCWQAVGRQIVGIYAGLRGTAPATGIAESIAIAPCRFRAEPHLL